MTIECFSKRYLFFADADGSITLKPGNRYEFMFGFELPQAGWVSFPVSVLQTLHSNNLATIIMCNLYLLIRCLVSSYVGKFGSVQYYVKAIIAKSGHSYAECKRYFEVEEPVDINTQELMVIKSREFTNISVKWT